MIKVIVFAALCAFAPTSFAASTACSDRAGKALPPEKCLDTPKVAVEPRASVPHYPKRKAMVLRNMRQAEGIIKTAIACAEKAADDAALQACAKS